MIVEFIIGLVLVWSFTYMIIKLIDQWKMKRLRKKFPEGSENKSIPVKRLGEVPVCPVENKVVPKAVIDALDELKETPTEFPEVSKEDLNKEE
jgi:hypothetical protein